MTKQGQPRILVVDDEDSAAAVAETLVAVGYQVSCTPRGLAGLVAVEEESPALVILSWATPFIDGHIFLSTLRTGLTTPPPVLALVSPDDDPRPAQAAGAHAVLARPVDRDRLVREVRQILLVTWSTGEHTTLRHPPPGRIR